MKFWRGGLLSGLIARMKPYLRDVLGVLAGSSSVESVSRRHGISVEEVEADRARLCSALVAALDQHARWPRQRVAVLSTVVALMALAFVVPTTAWGQLVTFTANSPAVASEVNGNFTQLHAWLEQKVGAVGTNNISTTGTLTSGAITSTSSISAPSITTTTQTVNGNAAIAGTLTTTGRIFANGGLTGSGVVINGVNIRVKNGNNGTVSCDSFCLGTSQGFSASCLGSRLPSGQYSLCTNVPGLLSNGGELTCLCVNY